jgi:16S rRNA (cytidine1402-2'-O)-methyltransferase
VSGILYLVATPIGNLEDITYRAVRVLKEADLIACEDTRHTRKLLDHYGIQKAAVSYHEHNEAARSGELVDRILAGLNVALVSDAGTPLVSDPGYRVVARAIAMGIQVVPVPGPSAILAALTASGLPTDSFFFGGFLPAKSAQRRKVLERGRSSETSLVFYEAPHRIVETLRDIDELLGKCPIVVGRELTKMHEEFLRGTAAEVLAQMEGRQALKGEMTIIIGKAPEVVEDDTPIPEAVEQCVRDGMSRMDAMKAVARRRGLSKREVYSALQEK